MSLIDEALKRARAQTDSQREPDAGAPAAPKDPWAYAPLPERRPRSRAAVTAAIAAGVAAGVAVAFLLTRTHRSGPAGSASSLAVVPVETARPARAGETREPLEHDGSKVLSNVEVAPPPFYRAPVAPAEGLTKGRAAEPAAARTSPAPAAGTASVSGMAGYPPAPVGSIGFTSGSPRMASNASPPPSSAAPQTAQAAPMSAAISERPAASTAASHIPARNLIGSFVAPNGSKIELGGIVFSESPVALINGRVLPVGGVTEGLTIVTIEQNRIELEGEGVHVFLSVK